jgi:pimeloyl-ACP methyl ester carboxylesterase
MQKQIVINNLLVNYSHLEGDTKRNILFVHGWGSDLRVWKDIMDHINAEGFNTFALDLPGFGKSQIPTNPMTIDDFSEIVKVFTEKLKLESIIIVGHSFGGATSIKFANNYPELVTKLVLINSSGIRLKREKNTLLLLGSKILHPIFTLSFMQPLRRKVYKLIGNEDYLNSGYIKETYLNVIGEDLTSILSNIKAETLIIWGDKDRDTPLWMGEKMKLQIPNSKLQILDGGHYSFLDRSEEFATTFIEFIKKDN